MRVAFVVLFWSLCSCGVLDQESAVDSEGKNQNSLDEPVSNLYCKSMFKDGDETLVLSMLKTEFMVDLNLEEEFLYSPSKSEYVPGEAPMSDTFADVWESAPEDLDIYFHISKRSSDEGEYLVRCSPPNMEGVEGWRNGARGGGFRGYLSEEGEFFCSSAPTANGMAIYSWMIQCKGHGW